MVVSSDSERCTWTEESVVRTKRLPTNTLGGKVRYWPSVSKGKLRLSLKLCFLRIKSCSSMGLDVSHDDATFS